MAALGGMVVPALLYISLSGGGEAGRGWGVPMATDIAFAMGVVALLGSRVPAGAKLMLLTLAIVDDIGAIVVIAVVYSSDVDMRMLLVAGAVVGAPRRVLEDGSRRTRPSSWCSPWRCGWPCTSPVSTPPSPVS